METRHMRIDNDEAIFSKKQLLTSELNLIHILKRMQNYKILRKKELAIKEKLKTQLSSFRISFSNLISTMPQQPITMKKKEREYSNSGELSIEDELNEIRRKLAELQ